MARSVWQTQLPLQERQFCCCLFDFRLGRKGTRVAGFRVVKKKYGPTRGGRALQHGSHFSRVGRIDSRVPVPRD